MEWDGWGGGEASQRKEGAMESENRDSRVEEG